MDEKTIQEGLDELLTLDDVILRIGARYIIRMTKTYIEDMSIVRQGFVRRVQALEAEVKRLETELARHA